MSRSFVSRWSRSVLLVGAVAGCADRADLLTPASGDLVIQAPASVASSVINFGGAGLDASLRNNSAQTVYANVGDAFNAADEQDPLFTSSGADAVVEAMDTKGSWTPFEQGIAIEGTKYVAISPGKTYRLLSNISAPSFRGLARIRVKYSAAPNASSASQVSYSNTFEIR